LEAGVLAEGVTSAGEHEAEWTGRDAAGRELPAGVYFCRLATPAGSTARKMVLVR
jgi:hypothetical protein